MRKLASLITLLLVPGMVTLQGIPSVVAMLLLIFGVGHLWAAVLALAALGGGIAGVFLVSEQFWRLIIAAAAA